MMKLNLIAKNTFYQTLARTVTSLIGFIITIAIAKAFGVSGYGEFTKVVSFVAIFYLVSDFGLNAIFLQYDKINFKNLFYLRIFSSLAIFIIVNLIAFILPYNLIEDSGFSDANKIGILIFSLTLFFQGIIFSASYVFQKSINYFYYMMGIVFGALINLFLIFLFTFLNFSIYSIYLSFVVSSFITAVTLLLFAKEKITPFYFDSELVKKIIIQSLPLGLILIFNLVYFRADLILLSFLSTTKSVGTYGLSYKFFDFLIALPLFLSNAVYPLLIKHKNDYPRFMRFINRYFFIFLLSSFVIMIPFWFMSPLFTLVDSEFSSSIFPFRILLLSLPFFFVTSFLQWVLITKQEQKYLLRVYFFSMILNIVLNIVFIPKFSYVACAVITVISEAIVFIFLVAKVFFFKSNISLKGANSG